MNDLLAAEAFAEKLLHHRAFYPAIVNTAEFDQLEDSPLKNLVDQYRVAWKLDDWDTTNILLIDLALEFEKIWKTLGRFDLKGDVFSRLIRRYSFGE